MEIIGKKLRQIREHEGLSQKDFAGRLNVNPVSMNRIEKGGQLPDVHVLRGLREVFGVDLNWLVGSDARAHTAISNVMALPVYDQHQLNQPEGDRLRSNVIQLQDRGEAIFAYQVRDESMFPLIQLNDYVLIAESEPQQGDLVLIRNEDGFVSVRRLCESESTECLVAENRAYRQDSIPSSQVQILGKVCRIVNVKAIG
jgi:transcriptional regulator with XRE-family HTH domain